MMEGIIYKGTSPSKNANPDKITFVQVDGAKCVGCDTCISYCPTGAIQGEPNKEHEVVDAALCINCAQCLIHCPVGAIYEEVSWIDKIKKALKDRDTVTVAMPAPAVRYTIAESFGAKPGTPVYGKLVGALKKLGFDKVWDVEFGADLTIMEEGTELVKRLSGELKKPIPQMTSCCPGWVKYVETFYPELLPNMSTAKSPVAMLSVMAKTYGAKTNKIDPAKMFTVSIMPCVAKKFEGLRPEHNSSGYRDIDVTITTRELAWLLKDAGIDLYAMDDLVADPLLGDSTGGATIFAASGGVMEAALRFASEKVNGSKPAKVEFEAVRGLKGIREATVRLGGKDVKVAVANGLKYAIPLCEAAKRGESPYHFIEVMACPGGCVNGGGNPILPGVFAYVRNQIIKLVRGFAKKLADIDRTIA
jgi:ferredoxin hydrogenase large subunit